MPEKIASQEVKKEAPKIRVAPKPKAEERKSAIVSGNFLDRPAIAKFYKSKQIIDGTKVGKDRPRFPTGIFPLDYCTGGGLPRWSLFHMYGPDGSGKTSFIGSCLDSLEYFCFRCSRPINICACKKEPKKMKGLVVAAEPDFDGFWITKIGAKEENFYVAYPEWLEQALTFIENGIMADDIGLVILDSLPALGSIRVQDKELEKKDFASEAQIIKRFGQHCNSLLIQLMREKIKPAFLIVTNQVRANMNAGQYGNPEDFYGAWSFRHQDGMRVRVGQLSLDETAQNRYGKMDLESQIQGSDPKKRMTNAVKHSFQLNKWHFPIVNKNGFFYRASFDIPERDLHMGQVDDYATVIHMGAEHGIFPSVSRKYVDDFKKDRGLYLSKQYEIIKKAKNERLSIS